jgi:chromosome segregation ATPase
MKIANEEMISYRKDINDKTRTIKRYDQSTNTLRREKDELKKQILLLNENKIKGDGEKDKIIQENFEKTTTIQELQSVKKQLQEDVVKIQKELKDTLKILKQTKARVKQLESELRHEKANFKEQNENYRDVSRQCKGLQRKLQEERQERREEVVRTN